MPSKTVISAASLVAVLTAFAAAHAQQPPTATPPAATPPTAPPNVEKRSSPPSSTKPGAPATPVVEAKPIKGHIVQQPQGTLLSTELVGADVNVGDQKKAGTVSNLILAKDGRVEGVVLSVGGFLGLGSREVAIKFEDVQIVTDGQKPVVNLAATKIDLEKASKFKSLADIKSEEDAAKARQQRPTVPGQAPSRPAN